jgi:serine-type D-Ala-D-Ala carboxypeptidase (penicillin-binding protein 5/6)
MMTTWVALNDLPVKPGQAGACETVTAADMALYRVDIAQQQSVAAIARGEHICERTLLQGIFVHSAGDYAQLLAQLTGLSLGSFVNRMNADAKILGMDRTHYVDETGISGGDVSIASDQDILTVALLTKYPAVAAVASLTKVWLPVAGVLTTFTPLLGQDGVVGVKSGYTIAAGGCDVMAINTLLGGTEVTAYIIILGQHSANALELAGKSGVNLYRSMRSSIARVRTSNGVEIEWTGTPSDVTLLPTP